MSEEDGLEEMQSMIKSWRWNFIFKAIDSVGGNLDSETWRMTKGEADRSRL